MNSINLKIKRLREQKGYSQEFMAAKLNISQASYARVESRKTNLSVDRLQKIAAILETDIPSLQSDPQLIVHSQTNNEGVYGNNYIENLHIENNEAMKKCRTTVRPVACFYRLAALVRILP